MRQVLAVPIKTMQILLQKITQFRRLIITTKKHTIMKKANKTALLIGSSMLKGIDEYLWTGSINRKYSCKLRPFSGGKTTDTLFFF